MSSFLSKLFHGNLDSRINKAQQAVDQDIVDELRLIALGQAQMTDYMRELLSMSPDIADIWKRFEQKKESSLSAIDVEARPVDTEKPKLP